ncbi:antitoxin Xre/MbcA/ParS toxin-binding domain-containing protein [Pseudomonas nitroreducens]|uniref:antitoxin Xre/MbcA/ParS toxin-binding domain-containing protein n=1 Tax=Pseudomonas nitroreducens TaxID=46680 RepID=UPI003D05450A
MNSHTETQISQQSSTSTDPISAVTEKIASAVTVEDALSASASVCRSLDKLGHKIGFDTLRNITKSTGKQDQIRDIFEKKYAEHQARQAAKICSMIKPLNTHKVDYRTLELNGSMALVGKMGEGKNVLCMEPWFVAEKEKGARPIFIAPLRSLLARFIGTAEHYKSVEDPFSLRRALRTTAHSFAKESYESVRSQCKTLFIDEVIKVTEAINSNIWRKADMQARIDGWKEIISAAKKAEKVVLSDAHLGQAYIEIIERLTGKSFPAFEPLTSTYSNVNVAYGYSQSSLIDKVLKITKSKVKVAYFFDGRIEDGKAIESLLNERGVKAIYLYSAERNNTEGKVYEASVNPESLADFDVVICSPSIGPGWSCTLPDFCEVMIECLGTISPASIIQCIKRFRAVENVSIAFSLESSRSNSRRNLPETASNVAFFQASEEFIDEAADHDKAFERSRKFLADPVGRAVCEMTALENWSRNRYEVFVVRALEALGFNVSFETTAVSQEIVTLKKKYVNEILDEKRAFFASDDILDGKALQAALNGKASKGADQRAEWLIEKSLAAQAMGITGSFSNDEVEFLIDKHGLEVLKRCDLLAGNGKVNNMNAVKATLFSDVLKFATSASVVFAADVDSFVEQLRSEKLRWNGKDISKFTLLTRTIFEVKGGGKPSAAAKGILSLLGFKLRASKCRTAGKYLIDSSLHDFAMSYVQRPSANKAKEVLDCCQSLKNISVAGIEMSADQGTSRKPTNVMVSYLGLPEESSEAVDMCFGLFADDERAVLAWLQAPVRGLGHKRPVDLLKTEEGRKQVIELIWKLENGVVV